MVVSSIKDKLRQECHMAQASYSGQMVTAIKVSSGMVSVMAKGKDRTRMVAIM